MKFEIARKRNQNSHINLKELTSQNNLTTLMTYQRFEDLPVWQEAARLYERVEDLVSLPGFSSTYGFRDQLDRASLSISNNIAEGFERGSTSELLAFIYIARGSAGEVRSMLSVKRRRVRDEAVKRLMGELLAGAESCSRQLRGWADALQSSDIKGQRHLNDKTRAEDERKRRAENFEKVLLRHLPAWHPKRKKAEEKGII